MASRESRLALRVPSAIAVVLASLAAPAALLAADDRLTGSAVSAVVPDPAPILAAVPDAGPGLLLLVAAVLGVLGILSGPEAAGRGGRRS
jgi:hypothetical protein